MHVSYIWRLAEMNSDLNWICLCTWRSAGNLMQAGFSCEALLQVNKAAMPHLGEWCHSGYLVLVSGTGRLGTQQWTWPDWPSVQFSCSVMSDSLWPHESQHARPPCPSPTPRVHSDSRSSSQWYHPAISSSVVPFSSCTQSSQHQSLFQWVNSSPEVAKVLEFQL